MAVTPSSPLNCAGVVLPAVAPVPSCPLPFRPQDQSVPADVSARLCMHPAARATTPERPLTATGTALFVVVPLPSSPCSLAPQAHGAPCIMAAGASAGRCAGAAACTCGP